MNWTPLLEMPKDLPLEGRKVRYNGHILGVIKSGWNRGLFLVKPGSDSEITPWFPPEGTIKDAAPKLEVETP